MQVPTNVKRALLLTTVLITNSGLLGYCDWPDFRGPNGLGVSLGADLPINWSEKENVTWKASLEGKGYSTPVILRDQIWVTTAVEREPNAAQIKKQLEKSGLTEAQFKRRQVAGVVELKAVCFDKKTGKRANEQVLFKVESPDAIHTQNSYASPSPVLEPGYAYFHFGANGTACVDTVTQQVVWKAHIQVDFSVGAGSSPFLYRNLLILVCDGIDKQFITALDKKTGKRVWTTPRPKMITDDGQLRKAYSTPIVVQHNGTDQLIVPGAQWVLSYDPSTGKELWRVDHGSGFSNVPRPIYADGLVYVCTGYGKPQLWAIRVDGKGDVTKSHVAWKAKQQIPARPSPVVVNGLVFVVSDNGIASCFDAKSGEQYWKKRLGGNHISSPIASRDRVYFGNEDGVVTVIQAAKEFTQLAKNRIEGSLYASPAVVQNTLFLRTNEAIYRIER